MADMMTFHLVTPEKTVASMEVSEVLIPSANGDMSARPGHAPVMVMLRPGRIAAQASDGLKSYAVVDGFAEITGKEVTILVTETLDPEALNRAEVERRMEIARQEMGSDNPRRAEAGKWTLRDLENIHPTLKT